MSSSSDDESRSNSESEYSDGENNGSPETWEAPQAMSRTMKNRMQQFNQTKESVKCGSPSITTEFVTSLSRMSKSDTSPPPERERPETTPPPEREHPETTPSPERERPETTPPPEEERPDQCMMSFKDKAKMFEKTLQGQKTNPFSALKLPPKDYEEAVKTDKDSNPVDPSSAKSSSERTQTDKDTNQVDPSSDKSSSERTQTDKNTNQVDPSSDATLERKVEGQGNKEKQPLQGHHFSEEPIEEHNPEQLNEGHSELDRTSPGPQLQHPRTEQYPGPRSAHGWPGTPLPTHQLLHSPYQQRQPLEQQGYIGRPVLPPSDPHNPQNLPPHPMWQHYDYPPIAQFPPPFNPQYRYETPGGIPSHHYRYETPGGIPSHHYRYETPGGIPSQHYRYETPGGIPFQHYRHETPGDIPPQQYKHETPGDIPPQPYRQGSQNTTSREPSVHVEPSSTNSEQPSSVSNVKSPTNPKQEPTEKKDNQGKKKPAVQRRQTPKTPYQQRQPLEQQGYIGRPVLPPTGPHNLQNLPPHPMSPQYHSQNTTSREPPVHGGPSSTSSEQPSSVSNVKSPTNPKQVPTEKDNQGKKKPVVQPRQTPKKLEGRGVSEAHKPAMQTKDNQKGPKTAIKPVPPKKKMGPKKMYLCVVGIAKDQSNDTVFNYLEGRSKMEIVYEESLRTEDNPEHAVIVFEDQIDLKVLEKACDSKKLKDSELGFDVIDLPRSVIVSSDDDKLTVKDVTDFLTKKKLETLKVRTTEEGSISVKFKSPEGVTEILKSTRLKIGGTNVVISVIYNCDHGTYWDHSLHRVAIPVPYKPEVLDKHVRSFVISITSMCNEHLEQHHACLSIKDEIHIECTLNPKHREVRQKVKSWKNTVIKAWDEFVQSNAHKKDLKITRDTKDLLVEHINSTKEKHRSDELTVTHDDNSMTIIFVGKSDIVENFYDEVSAKKEEIQENLKRKNRIKTKSMIIKPIEITLILKENKFNQLKNIAPDFTYDVNEENGMITFTGVEEDISEAKLAVFEVKKNYNSCKMTTLSCNQCRLLKNEAVVDILEQSLSDKNITAVFEIRENEVLVCTTCQDDCKSVENVLEETVVEDEIRLDDTSKNVLTLDEWAEQKVNITNQFRDVSYVDDSADDRIVVVATCNVLNEIMEDLENFVTEHSIYNETIKIKDEAELKYFNMHLKDWVTELEYQNNDQGLHIKFDKQSLQLSGTKQAITTASSGIHSQIRKIQRNQHTITKAGVDSLFNDQSKTDVLLSPIEEESKTVIIVDQNSLTKSPLHRNPVTKESDENWVRRQPSKYFSRKGTRPKQGAFTPKSGPVVCQNGTKITLVKKEDIGQQKADVIVCSTNGQLDMSTPAGKSIVKVAGKEILDEIKNTYSEGIKHGDIAVLSGYKLQCQKVYLTALPKWMPGGEKNILKCINTCLLQAASNFKSIVFPAMGTGNLHYPRDLVAEVMYQCIQRFDKSNSSLKEIKFLCYDPDTIQAFEREEAKIMNPGYQPAVAAARKQTNYKKHNITVRVVEGDLGKQKVDVMVSAVPKDLNLESAGGAGVSIMKGLGQVVQQDIANQHPNGVTNGTLAVVTLSSPVGRCKAVYLTSLDSWDSEKKVKDTDKQICKFGYSCLETADKAGYKSIAIPAMGTGTIGYPRDKVAAYMYDLVEKFANNNKQSKVSEVIFVVHYKDPKSKQAFLDEEKNRVPPPAPVVVPKTGALHGFATEETSTHTAVTVKPINDNDFQVGKLTFTVEQGDILSKRCDAIVNGSNDDLDLTKGAVSQAIRKKCDAAKLDAECTKKKDDMKQYGVVSTSGCGLPVKYIIHISSKHNPYKWRKVIKEALRKAEKKALKTLAFPALGTGPAGTDQEEMGKTIVESLVEFVGEGQITHLQHVYLVIFEAKMVEPMLKGVRSGGQAVLSADKQKQVIKSSNQQMCSVSFWIYSMSRRETSVAKEQLDKAVLEKYKTEKSCDRIISELSPNELLHLQSVENNYPIMLTINQRSNEVTIEGIAEYAISAKQDVFDWLRKFSHTRHCEAEAEIIKEQAQWFMMNKDPTTGLMKLEPYPPIENMHLENAYKGNSNRTDVDFKDEHGEEYIIDLKTMTEFPKNNPKDRMDVIRREKLQGHGGTFEPPPDWIDQGTENVKVVTLISTTPEYQSIEKRFITSVKNGKFAKTSPDVINKKVTVKKIERIQNLNLFRMYAAKRSLMENQNQNTKNEQELWHGTPESAIDSINQYGFNRSYCASNSNDAWWGQGVYFANDASYSVRDFLARPGAGGTSQDRNIYLCLVLTGVSRKGTKHEPLRYLPTRTDGTMLPYDSNTDDLNPPLEYVVFNDTQAYPQYRIKFTLI